MSEFTSGDHPLPFNEAFHEAIIGHCINNSGFFLKCFSRLKPQWFSKNIMLGTIFSQLCKYYEFEDAFVTSVDEFKNLPFFLEQKLEDREKYYKLIDKCSLLSARNFDLDSIERQLTGFLRVSMFKESIEGAAQRYKAQGFDSTYSWTKKRIEEISSASFEDNEFVMSFELPSEWIVKRELRRTQAISTGNSALDAALGGGLFKKETCAFMAPSNVGKTTSMITIARHALVRGLDVMFLIHEGDPEEIRFRILCAFMGLTQSTMFEWAKDPAKIRLINGITKYIEQHLTYIPYIKTGSMYIEDVTVLIKKMHEERKLKKGKGYDLIIDDYPKKLKSRARSGSKENLYRAEVAEVYDTFNHLATELDVHCFLAIQTNRAGLKQNNNRVEASLLLGMEEIDEAFGIAQNMANIITLNRSPDDKRHNIMRMNIAKSRNQETDIAVSTRTKFDCSLIFGDKAMFENDMWKTDLPLGFLASWKQDTNEKHDVISIDNELKKQEEAHAVVAGTSVGVVNINGKLDA